MKIFKCSYCGQLLYFENNTCENCGYALGFLAADVELHPIILQNNDTYTLYKGNAGVYRYCENHAYNVCNWLIPADKTSGYCEACELNNTIPNLSKAIHTQLWNAIETAKHRLIYSLLQMRLPFISKHKNYKTGLAFNFLADNNINERILTGHDNGMITLNIAEADDIKREMARKQMDEPYRTLLGHFRHEIGHYYWDRLIHNSIYLEEYRSLFGDERENYDQALIKHYRAGAPSDWRNNFISAYASTHSWEDWAETWAHYMHIIDTLETAHAFDLNISPRVFDTGSKPISKLRLSAYSYPNFDDLINMWLPLTFAMNSLNRSMGHADLYPFVIPRRVMEKLNFINKVCYNSAGMLPTV
jgi:hypothetical protein